MSYKNWITSCFCKCKLIILLLCLGFSAPVIAQVSGGSFIGRITDPSGAVLINAQVVIKNTATGVATSVSTNSAGMYSVPGLIPGIYEISVTAQGFSGSTRTGVTLTVGAQEAINFTLQIGATQQQVIVTTAAPMIETTNSTIGAVVNQASVQQLPLNGRSWTDLASLQPGVNAIHYQPDFSAGSDRGNRGFGSQVTISGTRPQMNNYLLDGVSLNDYANGAPGNVMGGDLGVDAIQEFSVLTTNYSPQYGNTAGGVVNAVTRSGTNSFHGGVYEFIRNDKLDAANYFEQGVRSPFRRNQFGGDIGGPIRRNKTFFFADYEGIRQAEGIAQVDTVPSLFARSQVTNPDVANFLAIFPKPNQNCASTALACKYSFSGNQIVNENYVTTRLDQTFSSKDTLYGVFTYDRTPYDAPDAFNNQLIGNLTDRQIAAMQEAHVFSPTLINALRGGYSHEKVNDSTSVSAINPATKSLGLGTFPGETAAQVQVAGLTGSPAGFNGQPHYVYDWTDYQVYDDINILRGTHNIKVGGNYERELLQWTTVTDPSGVWHFSSVQSFLAGNASKFQGGVPGNLTPRNLRQSISGLYFEDDWQAKPRLTFNIGARYEVATIPIDTNGKLVNLYHMGDQYPVCGTYLPPYCNTVGKIFSTNPTLYNLEPRFGFAWSPLKSDKMSVRAGAGMFDVLPLPNQLLLTEGQAAPFFKYTILKNGISFYHGIPPIDQLPNNSLRAVYMTPNPGLSYLYQYNLSIQYQLAPSLAMLVAYVGSNGFQMPFRVDNINGTLPSPTNAGGGLIFPNVDALGNLWNPALGCNQTDPNGSDPDACVSPTMVNPHYGTVRGMIYDGRSNFNSLEVGVTKRMSHGLQLQGSFTWGRSLDTSSATIAGDQFGNSISSLPWYDMRHTWAPSDFNVDRNLVVSALYDVPGPNSGFAPARWIANGWELGGIVTAQDGVPFTATWGTGSDPSNSLSGDDYAYPEVLGNKSGCSGSLVNPGNANNYIKTDCFSVPTAPDQAYWNANCMQVPPSLGAPVNQTPGLPSLACFNLMGNVRRNFQYGPGIGNLDFSVYKNNRIPRISERFNVQFRAEAFNVTNHPDFAGPDTYDANNDLFDGTGASLAPSAGGNGGQLVRTTVPQREIQFAVKVEF